jgi:hypothetical protein
MRNFWKATITAAAMAAAFATPAAFADGFSLSFGSGGVGFSYDSGGYCDRWGCPDGYWDYPIYDCPVFYGGSWYRGPVYYRRSFGRTYYWIHGDWRRDEWRGARPGGYCVDRFRPALGFEFYERDSRFRIRDEWRQRWHRDHDRDGRDRGRQNNGWGSQGGRDHRDNDNRNHNNRGNAFFGGQGNQGAHQGGNQGGRQGVTPGGNQGGRQSATPGGNQSGRQGVTPGGKQDGKQGGGHRDGPTPR